MKEMVQTVANFEGAHSIDVGRLEVSKGEKVFKAAKRPAPHILKAVTLFGIQYPHLFVIKCALYLYEKLSSANSIERPSGDLCTVTPALWCAREQAESRHPDWLEYRGGMMVSFSGAPVVVSHKISAVK